MRPVTAIGFAPLCLVSFLTLSACGGGGGGGASTLKADDANGGGSGSSTTTYSIGGVISGNDAAVRLSLNGVAQSFAGPSFTFDRKVATGKNYTVGFVSTPANQRCTVKNGSGVVARDVTDIEVTCTAPISTLRFNDAHVIGRLNAGDLNGDGFEDLVFSMDTNTNHSSGNSNHITRTLYGQGNGVFGLFDDILRTNNGRSANEVGRDAVAADLTGDGIADYAHSTGADLQIFKGTNASGLQAHDSDAAYAGQPLVAFDADYDGALDLIGMVHGLHHLYFAVYKNDGTGQMAAPVYFGSGLLNPKNFTADDFNGDGKIDLLAIGDLKGLGDDIGLEILWGNGDGTFVDPASLIPLPDDLFLGGNDFDVTHKEIASGDFDSDGKIDIAITSTTDFLYVMKGDGAGGFTEHQRVKVGFGPIHIRANDFNNDGLLDLASLNDDAKTLQISLGQNGGGFGDLSGGSSGYIKLDLDNTTSYFDMVVSDFDLDGFPDIALVDEQSQDSAYDGFGAITLILSPGK